MTIESFIIARNKVVSEAMSWLATPYHTGGRIKGAGVDCLTLLAEVYMRAGIIPNIEIPYYPKDWHLHRDNERYLNGLLQYAHEVELPEKGDIILWKFGRCFSHGAIVVDYPMIIHAYVGRECTLENMNNAAWLNYIGENSANNEAKKREVKFFSVW